MQWKRFFKKTKKNLEKTERKHRKKILALIIIGALLFLFLSTKTALYVNFLLGNDIVVRLDQSAESLTLPNGVTEQVTFGARVATNPFCKATCIAAFHDISTGTTLDMQSFDLRPSNPFTQEYDVTARGPGEGQQLYRFTMECQSTSTLLCHTSGKPTSRTGIITVDHILTEQEQETRETVLNVL